MTVPQGNRIRFARVRDFLPLLLGLSLGLFVSRQAEAQTRSEALAPPHRRALPTTTLVGKGGSHKAEAEAAAILRRARTGSPGKKATPPAGKRHPRNLSR